MYIYVYSLFTYSILLLLNKNKFKKLKQLLPIFYQITTCYTTLFCFLPVLEGNFNPWVDTWPLSGLLPGYNCFVSSFILLTLLLICNCYYFGSGIPPPPKGEINRNPWDAIIFPKGWNIYEKGLFWAKLLKYPPQKKPKFWQKWLRFPNMQYLIKVGSNSLNMNHLLYWMKPRIFSILDELHFILLHYTSLVFIALGRQEDLFLHPNFINI